MDKACAYYQDCYQIYYPIKDITVNCPRSGATSQTYTVSNSDNSAAGSYSCIVTVSTVTSPESSCYSLSGTGIPIFRISNYMHVAMHDVQWLG